MDKFIPKYTNAQVIEELKRGNNEVVECFFYWKGPSIKELNDMERRAPGSTRKMKQPICATVYRGLIKVMSQLFRDEGFEYNEKVNDLYIELLEKDKFSKLDDPNKLEAWTIRTARNFYIDSIRKANGQRIKTVIGADLSRLLVEDVPTSDTSHQWIYKAIERLSKDDQELIRKLFFTPHKEKNKEYRQKLAAQMGVSIAYFYTKSSRAIERLLVVATEMLGKQAIRDREYAYREKDGGLTFEQYASSNLGVAVASLGNESQNDLRNDAEILAQMADLLFDAGNDDDEHDAISEPTMEDASGDIQCEAFIMSEYLSQERISRLLSIDNGKRKNLSFEVYGRVLESQGVSIKRFNSNFSSLNDYVEKGQKVMAIVDYGELINGARTGYYQPLVCISIKDNFIHVFDPMVDGERDFKLSDFSSAWLQSGNFLVCPQIPNSFYEPHPINIDNVRVKKELGELVEMMARNNHEVWADKKVKKGWKYAPFHNEERQTNPDLAPYAKIGKVAKEMDKKAALGSIKVIQQLGYRIVRKSPYYCRECGETVEYGMRYCPECGAKLGVQ